MYPQRRSVRLREHDYALAGAYFVTICAAGREPLFGTIEQGGMLRNALGCAVDEAWRWLGETFSAISLDEWVIMPNHVHGIVVLDAISSPVARSRKSLGSAIGAFKANATRRADVLFQTTGSRIWQRGYYEHIIRDENELRRIRRYIVDNPCNWTTDEENPDVRTALQGRVARACPWHALAAPQHSS